MGKNESKGYRCESKVKFKNLSNKVKDIELSKAANSQFDHRFGCVRRTKNRVVLGKYLLNRQRGKDVLPENLCPGRFDALFAFGSQVGKGIEHVRGFVILDVDHAGSLIAKCDDVIYHKTPCAATEL